MTYRHFEVLMWKSCRLKLYHWIALLLELLLPIGMTWIFVMYAKWIGPHSPASESPHPKTSNTSVSFIPRNAGGIVVELCYSPDTPATTKFMNEIQNDYSKNCNNYVKTFGKFNLSD